MRVFVAIELEHALKRSLLRVGEALSAFRKDVRWVKESQMHVTLKFLGEVDDGRVSDVCDACRQAAARSTSFTLSLDGCGCFPPHGKVRVVWGGTTTTPGELVDCALGCEDALANLGFDREQRPFAAHMTVGRVRNDRTNGRLREAVEATTLRSASQWVNSLTVFQSVLQPHGPQYTPIGRFRFGKES